MHLEGFQVVLNFSPQNIPFYTILNIDMQIMKKLFFSGVRKNWLLPYGAGRRGSQKVTDIRFYFLTPSLRTSESWRVYNSHTKCSIVKHPFKKQIEFFRIFKPRLMHFLLLLLLLGGGGGGGWDKQRIVYKVFLQFGMGGIKINSESVT